MFMSEDQFYDSSEERDEDDERSITTEEERQTYTPASADFVQRSRPDGAQVRPVSARTYKSSNTSATGIVRMYNNDLFGDEGDVLAFVDDRSRANTITEQPSAAPQKQQFNSPKLQQQKTVAGRRRIQRLQAGGITVSNTTLSPKARPGSVRRPFGGGAYNPQTMSRAPAAGESAPATTAVNQKSTKSAVAVPVFTPVATPIAVTESGAKNNRESSIPEQISSTEKVLKAKGIDTVFDPTGTLDIPLPQSPLAAVRPQLTFPDNCSVRDRETFLLTPGPKTNPFLCFIVRDRSDSKMYPRYSLYVDEGGKFLLSARKRKKSKSSNYLISLDDDDMSRDSSNYFGKVRSNFIGTEFVLYDKGCKSGKKQKNGSEEEETRVDLGGVVYQHNVLGTRGPRKMTALLPKVDRDTNNRIVFPGDKTMIDRFKADECLEEMVIMKNKTPKWNEQLNAYCLNFKGRVTEASVKNFQLVTDDEPENVILQFGKVGKDTFTMDFSWPISALQAFTICMTSFDSKLACE